MISNVAVDGSEKQLMDALHRLSDAGCSVIQIRTREPIRAATLMRKNFLGGDAPYREWDVVNGWRNFTTQNYVDHTLPGSSADPMDAFEFPLNQLRTPTSEVRAKTDKIHYFTYLDLQPYLMNNPRMLSLLQQYANALPTTNVCIFLITPDITIPGVPLGSVLMADMPVPTAPELEERLKAIIKSAEDNPDTEFKRNKLKGEDYTKVAQMGLGLSLFEFETYTALAIIEAGEAGEDSITRDRLINGIAQGKTAVVKSSEILELVPPEDINNIGGMQKLKDWLLARANCYSEDAQNFGVEPPKGMVVVGVPGTGKSLVAKATASTLDVPLVRLDFARIFSKFVGDSESRVREALKMVESMAPVVLFVDEIDKGLGGAGGGGDAGTSSRVLGSFLTWLQDCKAPVFTVVTANRVDGLPPELLRRGRFDQIWSVGLPSSDERRAVLDIHLRKRGRELADFTETDIISFLSRSDSYVPAEIESAVKDALIMAFNDPESEGLEIKHLLNALGELVPLAHSHRDRIAAMVEWAQNNATSVAYKTSGNLSPGDGENQAPVVRARRTTVRRGA